MSRAGEALKLTLVVQRYGHEIVGGAERLARGVAEGLTARGHDVEVLTTCATSYRTWANHFSEGVGTVDGVRVRRFRTLRERDMDSFNALSQELFGSRRAADPRSPGDRAAEEIAWVEAQGPYVPALVDHLHAAAGDRDALIFFTYLYYPTVHGIHAAPRRSVLVPTAHDEAPLYLETYRSVFTLPAGLVFNTHAEAELVARRFPEVRQPSAVLGVGIEDLEELEAEAHRVAGERRAADAGIAGQAPEAVLLYAGRIEEGKGVGELLSHLARYRREGGRPFRLQLMGETAMDLPDEPWIEPLGFVPAEEKRRRLAEATLLVAPSSLESFGIVLLEANAAGTPALANGASAAYVEHCTLGGGGLWYESHEEMAAALDLLLADTGLRAALARQGARYVRDRFSWDAIARRYEEFLRRLLQEGAERPS